MTGNSKSTTTNTLAASSAVVTPITGAAKVQPAIWKEFIAGGVGGVCEVISGHPLDTIKVRLQTMPVPVNGDRALYTGTMDCIRKTVSHEGVLGLYKGMATPVAVVTPSFALGFFGYGLGKHWATKYHGDPNRPLSLTDYFWAGAFSGIFTTIAMAPGERIKCLLQIQQGRGSGTKLYSGPMDCARQLYREGGIRSIYKGTVLTLMRDIPASGAYFASYEGFKQLLTPVGHDPDKLSFSSILVAGGIAGICNWVVAIMPDVLKSRYQTAPADACPSMLHLVRDVLRTEGLRGMYRGFVPVMIRAFPANACCFLGYEVVMKGLNYQFKEPLVVDKTPRGF